VRVRFDGGVGNAHEAQQIGDEMATDFKVGAGGLNPAFLFYLRTTSLRGVLSKPMIGKRPSNPANETSQQNNPEQNIASQIVGYSALYSSGNEPHQGDNRCRSRHSANEESQCCHHTGINQGPLREHIQDIEVGQGREDGRYHCKDECNRSTLSPGGCRSF
jgi:hypothetical protein